MSAEQGKEAIDMSIVTDERLMAYADGALPIEEARALEIMLAEDPVLAERLRPFAMTGAPLAQVFDTITAEPIPSRLITAIAAHAPATAPGTQKLPRRDDRASPSYVDWLARAFGLGDVGTGGAGFAVANAFAVASLVIVGALAGYSIADQSAVHVASAFTTGSQGQLIAAGALASALETQASSDAANAAGVVTRSAFLAKATGAGSTTYCREYRLSRQDTEASGGVACRAADGAWRIATHTRLKSATSKPGSSYGTASGEENPAIEATIGSLIEGDLLTPDQENAVRAGGWK